MIILTNNPDYRIFNVSFGFHTTERVLHPRTILLAEGGFSYGNFLQWLLRLPQIGGINEYKNSIDHAPILPKNAAKINLWRSPICFLPSPTFY
jgi:hypothetical protein